MVVPIHVPQFCALPPDRAMHAGVRTLAALKCGREFCRAAASSVVRSGVDVSSMCALDVLGWLSN